MAMRVLGIDPGMRITGYGCVIASPAAGEPKLAEAGVLRFKAGDTLERRLNEIYQAVRDLIEELKPDEAAVEKLYAHYRHPRTAILMGHARGVILLACAGADVPVTHLPSTEVKKSITGNGHASKEQMQRAIQSQCALDTLPEPPDLADAIAIAITGARRLQVNALT